MNSVASNPMSEEGEGDESSASLMGQQQKRPVSFTPAGPSGGSTGFGRVQRTPKLGGEEFSAAKGGVLPVRTAKVDDGEEEEVFGEVGKEKEWEDASPLPNDVENMVVRPQETEGVREEVSEEATIEGDESLEAGEAGEVKETKRLPPVDPENDGDKAEEEDHSEKDTSEEESEEEEKEEEEEMAEKEEESQREEEEEELFLESEEDPSEGGESEAMARDKTLMAAS